MKNFVSLVFTFCVYLPLGFVVKSVKVSIEFVGRKACDLLERAESWIESKKR